MDIIKQDFRKGYARIKITDAEDLWHLSQVLLPGDIVQGRSFRKVKIETGSEKAAVAKKTIIVKIQAEKINFDKGLESLRVNGKVVNEIEDVPKGSYHSLDINVNDMIDIEKDEFLDYQIKYLKEASSGKKAKILIAVLDREEASFGLVKSHGIEMLSEISGNVEKKYVKEKISKEFYNEIIENINDYDKRFSFETIIIGSPAFWKDEIFKRIPNEMKKKVILSNCNHVGKSGMNELLKSNDVKKALAESRVGMESSIVEDLLLEISKSEKAVYGINDVKEAVLSGAVETLIVSTKFIADFIEKGSYKEVNEIMKSAEKSKGTVKIVNSDNEPGQKLDGIGGIGGILRYKIKY